MRLSARFAVLIPAAGSGSRIGGEVPKQYVEILGESVLRHTLRAFAEMEDCAEVIVAIDEQWEGRAIDAARGMRNVRFTLGGSERQHSIRNAVDALRSDPDVVLVHDAARPAVSAELVRRVVQAAMSNGAAIPGLPIAETIKLVDSNGLIVRTVPREGLYVAQTPQGFRTELLRRAYAQALETGFVGTDDASLVERLGERVVVVEGEIGNIKITWGPDFKRVEEALRELRMKNYE